MSEHTPGPWRYDPTQDTDPSAIHADAVWYITESREDGEEDVVALIVKGTERGHSQANARLIAAAPEMLRLLKLLTNDNQSTMREEAAKSTARALLARIAEGRDP